MAGNFDHQDPSRCQHYAQFASSLDRIHLEALYWTFFFLVIMALFSSSWFFQWTMKYRDDPNFTMERFRKRLTVSLVCTLGIFLIAVVILAIEVYTLLAIQFCEQEDLISLYWATWTTLQLGSEIAILGVSLALWHHLWDMEHPLWALALGTPVLVVAGFGHLLSLVLRQFYHKAKARSRSNKTRSTTASLKGPELSSHTTVEKIQVQSEKGVKSIPDLELGQKIYFAMDVGDDERMQQWPCFVCVADGKAVVRMTAVSEPVITSESSGTVNVAG
ncbi:hypothetical protein F5Y12DRAFT_794288 [Xylaria sp. FL1777]|nr:hypothetical protein F5Y12DRAFT_794288 [Xylaria sp. FL1777]